MYARRCTMRAAKDARAYLIRIFPRPDDRSFSSFSPLSSLSLFSFFSFIRPSSSFPSSTGRAISMVFEALRLHYRASALGDSHCFLYDEEDGFHIQPKRASRCHVVIDIRIAEAGHMILFLSLLATGAICRAKHSHACARSMRHYPIDASIHILTPRRPREREQRFHAHGI